MKQPDYFDMTPDSWGPTPRKRWQPEIEVKLPSGEWWDVWAYTRCQPAPPPPYAYTIYAAGPVAEVNITATGCIPMVSERVAHTIWEIAKRDLQRIPVTVQDDPENWEILNVLSLVDCFDYERSIVTPCYPPDHPDPTRAGKPRGVIKLIIDPVRASGHDIFRVKDWNLPVIVSDRVRHALEEIQAVGVRFEKVTP